MDLDLEDLEAKARAASPGPWLEEDGLLYSTETVVAVVCRQGVDPEIASANTTFLAAFGPDVILALIERAKRASNLDTEPLPDGALPIYDKDPEQDAQGVDSKDLDEGSRCSERDQEKRE